MVRNGGVNEDAVQKGVVWSLGGRGREGVMQVGGGPLPLRGFNFIH